MLRRSADADDSCTSDRDIDPPPIANFLDRPPEAAPFTAAASGRCFALAPAAES